MTWVAVKRRNQSFRRTRTVGATCQPQWTTHEGWLRVFGPSQPSIHTLRTGTLMPFMSRHISCARAQHPSSGYVTTMFLAADSMQAWLVFNTLVHQYLSADGRVIQPSDGEAWPPAGMAPQSEGRAIRVYGRRARGTERPHD
jgi:hypothetical protein